MYLYHTNRMYSKYFYGTTGTVGVRTLFCSLQIFFDLFSFQVYWLYKANNYSNVVFIKDSIFIFCFELKTNKF